MGKNQFKLKTNQEEMKKLNSKVDSKKKKFKPEAAPNKVRTYTLDYF